MKKPVLMSLLLSLALAIAPTLSEAKRLGAGRSSGMQRNMPARTAPETPAKPAQPAPQQAQPATPAQTPAAQPRRSWMGPLAGLAAGLGIGALLSHFGMGGAFGNAVGSLLMIALLAIGAVFLFRLFARRNASGQPAFAGGMARTPTPQVAWPQRAEPAPLPAAAPAVPAVPAVTRAFVPASFDSDGFARTAKALFIRLQAANDSGDLDDLRRFTTPEMYAELKVDLQDRAGTAQTTEVVHVDAEVLDLEDDGSRQVASVRFHGRIREEKNAPDAAFDEVWHLVKPRDDSRGWAIAGIEQMPARPTSA